MEGFKQRNSRRWRSYIRPFGSMISLISVALLLVGTCPSVYGYSAGAPAAVCDTMLPSHGAVTQTIPSPYTVLISKHMIKGLETLDITITSKSGNDQFKGFLIQVRKVGSEKPSGHFSGADNAEAQMIDCHGLKDSGMTHKSGDLKNQITVHWVAPNEEDAEYHIFYTVVGQSAEIFWSHMQHEEKISVTKDLGASTTAAPIIIASNELREKWKNIYGGCGESKGCFGIPGKCASEYTDSENPTTCDILVTWAKLGETNVFELTGKPGGQSGHVALGISSDAQMGQDSVVACIVNNGNLEPSSRYHNTGQAPPVKYSANSTHGLKHVDHAFIEGNIFCKFSQTNHKIADVDVNFENNFFILLAKASSLKQNSLSYHVKGTDREASPQAVHITETTLLGATTSTKMLIQLHGGFMVIAWLLCASTGMFTARYFKLTHTDFNPLGKAFWFALHITCMAATVFLTICGAVFIFIAKKYTLKFGHAHPILGVIVIGLAIVQVLIAFLRPHPGTPSRPYFNWFHWAVGNSAHIVGIICILLASDLGLAELKRFGDENLWGWILLGFVLFHVLMHIVMSIHTLWADKQMDSDNKKRAMQPGPMKNNGLNSEAPGTAFRTFMLSLYLLVMAAGAIALTALVFWPAKEDSTS